MMKSSLVCDHSYFSLFDGEVKADWLLAVLCPPVALDDLIRVWDDVRVMMMS